MPHCTIHVCTIRRRSARRLAVGSLSSCGVSACASALGRPGVLGGHACALAQGLGLLSQHLHLALDVFGLQLHHVLDILGPQQLLGELERAGDVLLGEADRLDGHVPGALAGGLRLPLEGADGIVGGVDEPLESLPRLVHALLGEGAHFGGNLESLIGGHTRLLPSPA